MLLYSKLIPSTFACTGGNKCRQKLLWMSLYPTFSLDPCNWQTIGFDSKELKFSVYPNPVTTVLNIELSQFMPGEIQLMNLQGEVVLQQTIQSTNEILDLSYLTSGMYLVIVKTENQIGIVKFVKE